MLGVVRRNPGFRRLWLAQVVSQMGDWFGRMAVLVMIGSHAGPGAALGVGSLYAVELAMRLLPAAVLGPVAGPLADRLPRRALMVTMDLARFCVVLGLLTVSGPEDLPWVYVLVVLQMGMAHVFNAARSAALPSTLPRSELHEAQTLSAATWSTMLTLGALFGGLMIGPLGVRGVLIVDGATYLGSAALLAGLRLPPVPAHPEAFRLRELLTAVELRRGLAHARELGVVPALLAKTMWGGAGGFLALLPILAAERFGPEHGAGLGTGLFYGARGLGTAVGPFLGRMRWGSGDRALRRQIGTGFLIGGAGYVLLAATSSPWAAVVWIVIAHMGGSALWVSSTVLWQRRVADAYQGRVFAIEFLGMTVAFSLGGFVAGAVFDRTGSSATTVLVCSALVLACGAIWWRWARRLVLQDEAGA